MGDKSEAFCRQTLLVLAQSPEIMPSGFDLAAARNDLAPLDPLRPRFQRLARLNDRGEDADTADGSDFMNTALDGCALPKVMGKGAGLDTPCARACPSACPGAPNPPPHPPPGRA